MVRAVFKMFGSKRVILISDTMRAAGMPDGDYTLGGQAVQVKGNRATLSDGTLAGSVTDLMKCMKTAVSFGIPLAEAVRAAAVNPAMAIGIFSRVGSLEPGKRANVVVLIKISTSRTSSSAASWSAGICAPQPARDRRAHRHQPGGGLCPAPWRDAPPVAGDRRPQAPGAPPRGAGGGAGWRPAVTSAE